jgi:hypothetical protein
MLEEAGRAAAGRIRTARRKQPKRLEHGGKIYRKELSHPEHLAVVVTVNAEG